MLSWVREKLAEGRLRWQQTVQPQRSSTSSPPPLPPPSAIDSPLTATTPETGPPIDCYRPNDNHLNAIPSPTVPTTTPTTTTTIPTHRPIANNNQNIRLQDNNIDSIKHANGSNVKCYPHISRKSQRFDHAFCPSQYDPVWPTNSNFQTSTSIVINRRPNDSTVPYVNLRIFNCIGSKCTICAPLTLTFADVKRKVVAEFHARRQLFVNISHHKTASAAATTAASATTTTTAAAATQYMQSPGHSSRDRIEEQKLSCDNLDLVQLSRHYKLARISKLHEDFDEQSSLATANVQNNEEMLLVLCSSNAAAYLNAHTKEKPTSNLVNPNTTQPTQMAAATATATATAMATATAELPTPIASTTTTPTATEIPTPTTHSIDSSGATASKLYFNCGNESDSDDNETTSTSNAIPTQYDIDLATVQLARRNSREPNVVNIDELVLQSDVQYDIRKILISLANSCAYVIGAGPYATRIITMLKQRLVQRKKHEQDTQQCLIEMGFSRSKVQHALNINNNVYAAALEWLIENQSPTNPQLSDEQSSTMNLSSKFTNNATIKDNIESLLEIIRIYCQRDLPPTSEMVQFIVGMGFDEATAREALKITKNHQSNACEWLVGDRSKINQSEQNDGLPNDSPILSALLNSPHVQLSLSNPKIFIAYLSILEDYGSMSMWLNDSETSSVIGQVLRTYHEEKHIMAINQFSKNSATKLT